MLHSFFIQPSTNHLGSQTTVKMSGGVEFIGRKPIEPEMKNVSTYLYKLHIKGRENIQPSRQFFSSSVDSTFIHFDSKDDLYIADQYYKIYRPIQFIYKRATSLI